MGNKLYILIGIITVITIFFRILPIFIHIPDNKKVSKFFELMPVSILTVLAFPDIFTSIGTKLSDILICLVAIALVIFMAKKKKSMGLTLFLSFILIILLKEVFVGKF